MYGQCCVRMMLHSSSLLAVSVSVSCFQLLVPAAAGADRSSELELLLLSALLLPALLLALLTRLRRLSSCSELPQDGGASGAAEAAWLPCELGPALQGSVLAVSAPDEEPPGCAVGTAAGTDVGMDVAGVSSGSPTLKRCSGISDQPAGICMPAGSPGPPA